MGISHLWLGSDSPALVADKTEDKGTFVPQLTREPWGGCSWLGTALGCLLPCSSSLSLLCLSSVIIPVNPGRKVPSAPASPASCRAGGTPEVHRGQP